MTMPANGTRWATEIKVGDPDSARRSIQAAGGVRVWPTSNDREIYQVGKARVELEWPSGDRRYYRLIVSGPLVGDVLDGAARMGYPTDNLAVRASTDADMPQRPKATKPTKAKATREKARCAKPGTRARQGVARP